jgi:hypothetical protein
LKGATALVSGGATLGIAEIIAREGFHTSFLDRVRRLPAAPAVPDESLSPESMHKTLTTSRYPQGIFHYNTHLQYSEHTRRFFWAPRGPIAGHKVHALGFTIPRNRDYDSFQPGGLMAGGCSCTYGSNVAREDTFSNVAGHDLRCDAYNYGMASYSYVTMLHQLEDLIAHGVVQKLRPRHYVLGAGSWLDWRSTTPFYPTFSFQMMFPYLGGMDGAPMIVNPSQDLTIRHVLELQARYFPGGDRHVELTESRRKLLDEMRQRLLAVRGMQAKFRRSVSVDGLCRFILPEFRRHCDAQDMELTVLWIPAKVNAAGCMEEMRAACSRVGCRFVDGTRVWHYGLDVRAAYQEDGHPSTDLHVALGHLLARELAT